MPREMKSKSGLESEIRTCACQEPGCGLIGSVQIMKSSNPSSEANWQLGVYEPGDCDSDLARVAIDKCLKKLGKLYDMAPDEDSDNLVAFAP